LLVCGTVDDAWSTPSGLVLHSFWSMEAHPDGWGPDGVILDEDHPNRVVISEDEHRRVEASPALRSMLEHPRLQRCIRHVLASSDRKAALERAMLNPQLREFVEAMLVTVGKAVKRRDGSTEFVG
jgi:hypothetical protein